MNSKCRYARFIAISTRFPLRVCPCTAIVAPAAGFNLQAGYQTRLTGLATDETEAMFMIGLPRPSSRARAWCGCGARGQQVAGSATARGERGGGPPERALSSRSRGLVSRERMGGGFCRR